MHSMRVSKFHRLVSVALSASLLAVTCQTTMAQEPAQLIGQSSGDSQVQERRRWVREMANCSHSKWEPAES